jgi:hypothetical protein
MMTPTKVKTPKFTKPKSLKALPAWTKKQELPELPTLGDKAEWEQNLVDDKVALWADALGSESLAKRLIKLEASGKYPDATLPELVALDWLEKNQYKHVFQQTLLGGRALKGGQVVDIVVELGSGVVILEVQGNYWHSKPGMPVRDAAQRLALANLKIYGKQVKAVIEVWESRLVQPIQSIRDDVMQCALLGIAKGK